MTYKDIAILIDSYFTTEKFLTSVKGCYRLRYEFRVTMVDWWINKYNPELIKPWYDIEEKSFKKGLFYHLRKLGWKPTDIKGRWKKQIYL